MYLDLKERLDLKENLDLLGARDPLVLRERKGKEVLVETQAQWALRELLVREVLLETEDSPVLMDYPAPREHKVTVESEESQDQRVPAVIPGAQESLVFPEPGV